MGSRSPWLSLTMAGKIASRQKLGIFSRYNYRNGKKWKKVYFKKGNIPRDILFENSLFCLPTFLVAKNNHYR